MLTAAEGVLGVATVTDGLVNEWAMLVRATLGESHCSLSALGTGFEPTGSSSGLTVLGVGAVLGRHSAHAARPSGNTCT